MNQILNTSDIRKNKKYKIFFKIQLIISIAILFFLVFYALKNRLLDNKKEDFSKTMYQTIRLKTIYNENTINSQDDSLYFCIIYIPKINIEYPVSAKYDEELLKLSPCKFFGTNINAVR